LQFMIEDIINSDIQPPNLKEWHHEEF